jgi:hypothetical protein
VWTGWDGNTACDGRVGWDGEVGARPLSCAWSFVLHPYPYQNEGEERVHCDHHALGPSVCSKGKGMLSFPGWKGERNRVGREPPIQTRFRISFAVLPGLRMSFFIFLLYFFIINSGICFSFSLPPFSSSCVLCTCWRGRYGPTSFTLHSTPLPQLSIATR